MCGRLVVGRNSIQTMSIQEPWMSAPETIQYVDGTLVLIDQTKLPGELVSLECRTIETTHDAIKRLVVRGAPAIGIAAAYLSLIHI